MTEGLFNCTLNKNQDFFKLFDSHVPQRKDHSADHLCSIKLFMLTFYFRLIYLKAKHVQALERVQHEGFRAVYSRKCQEGIFFSPIPLHTYYECYSIFAQRSSLSGSTITPLEHPSGVYSQNKSYSIQQRHIFSFPVLWLCFFLCLHLWFLHKMTGLEIENKILKIAMATSKWSDLQSG